MKEAADKLYAELSAKGIDVLLDDRDERPGVKFNDMDLIGFPVRVTIGEKNLPDVEIKLRSSDDVEKIPLENSAEKICQIIQNEFKKLQA
jgi:prolyl-tRNA synthetase